MELLHVVCPHCDRINRLRADRLRDAPRCGRCHDALFTGTPVELRDDNFAAHVTRSDVPVLVDFWAPWCGPCLAMAPVFKQAARALEPRVRLAKLDTEAQRRIAMQFGIRSIPTLALFRGGREIARRSGAMTLPALLDWIAGNLEDSPRMPDAATVRSLVL